MSEEEYCLYCQYYQKVELEKFKCIDIIDNLIKKAESNKELEILNKIKNEFKNLDIRYIYS